MQIIGSAIFVASSTQTGRAEDVISAQLSSVTEAYIDTLISILLMSSAIRDYGHARSALRRATADAAISAQPIERLKSLQARDASNPSTPGER